MGFAKIDSTILRTRAAPIVGQTNNMIEYTKSYCWQILPALDIVMKCLLLQQLNVAVSPHIYCYAFDVICHCMFQIDLCE